MLALLSFLIVILFSLIIVKIGCIALETTGLSREISQFQAQSAFSGVGFTTAESETLMRHAFRRKILRFLMLMGSAGLTSAVATLILTFMNTSGETSFFSLRFNSLIFNISTIIFVLSIVYLISRTEHFDKFIRWTLHKPLHMIKSRMALYDYEKILGLSKGYSIVSFDVPSRHWMVKKTIGTLKLEKEGVIVLGIFRTVHGHEDYVGIPSDDFKIHYKDKIIAYCKETAAENLAKREKGMKGKVLREEAVKLHKKLNLLSKMDEDKLAQAAKITVKSTKLNTLTRLKEVVKNKKKKKK